MLDKFLTAESRIYPHYQYHINIIYNVPQHSHRSSRVDSNRRQHSRFTDLLHYPMQMRTRLIVHVHYTRPQSLYFRNKLFRLHYHQMHVQRLFRKLRHIFQHRKAERDVGNKHAVHYIDVHPVGFTAVNHFNIICQIRKIGRQYGRGYYRFHISYILLGYMNYNKQIYRKDFRLTVSAPCILLSI